MPMTDLHARKKRTNLAILFILLAWVALIFTVAIVKMSPAGSSQPLLSSYEVKADYKNCSSDTNCQEISTTCDGCCQRGAVHKDFTDPYERERETFCAGYDGAVCDCCASPMAAKCQAGICVLVPDPSRPDPCR